MPIRVERVRSLPDGSVEVMFRGQMPDAKYVAERLRQERDASVSLPQTRDGMPGFLFLIVQGTDSRPYTAARARQLLCSDPEIEVRDQDDAEAGPVD